MLQCRFQMMQDNFDYLSIDEYSLCQTTLEQVFNAFARQQVQNELGDSEEAKEIVAPKLAEVENVPVPVETVSNSVFSKSKEDAFDIVRSTIFSFFKVHKNFNITINAVM